MRTNCPGTVQWRLLPSGVEGEAVLDQVLGGARIAQRYEATLGPFGDGVQQVRLRFRCQDHLQEGQAPCVRAGEPTVRVGEPGKEAAKAR